MMSTKCMFICPTKYNYNFVKPERVKYAVLTMMSHVADLKIAMQADRIVTIEDGKIISDQKRR